MKIGKGAMGGLHLAFTDTEYAVLGNPNRVNLKRVGDTLVVYADSGTGSGALSRNENDATHRWRVGMSKQNKVAMTMPVFGSEQLSGKSPPNGGEIVFPMPAMKTPPRQYSPRTSGRGRPEGRPGIKSVPTEEAVQLTLDAAVEFINKRKDTLGDRLRIEVSADGYLDILQRSGR